MRRATQEKDLAALPKVPAGAPGWSFSRTRTVARPRRLCISLRRLMETSTPEPTQQPAGDRVERVDSPFVGKTAQTILVMLAALAVPYASPRLRALRVVPAPWERTPSSEEPVPAPVASAPPAAGEQVLPASENVGTINNELPSESSSKLPDIDPEVRPWLHNVSIEDATGHTLDAFFARLARTDRGETGAVTRILHYGDSTIASDYISGTMRRRLQARFGDAGHGFILIANPWEWYFHNDVNHGSSGEWKASRLAGPVAPDGMYGLGGVSFSSYGGDAAWFGTTTRGDYGRHVGRFDVYYLEQPGGGDIEVSINGGKSERFSTRGDGKVSRVHSVRIDDGEAKLNVRSAGGGPARLFGVALERERPGVVYDALGSHAAMAVYWRRQNAAHWKEQLALRDPALVIFQYGTNESDLWKLDRAEYEQALAGLIDELRDAAGGAPVLMVAPLDRAESKEGRLVTKQVILDLVAIQRRVALAHGAAFFDTFTAMGGEGSMARWYRARPQLAGGDLTHPTPLGAEVLGTMLSGAIVRAYETYVAAASR
jgi:lysophospholipase L1-like esterase